jgi:hypothetical protein
MPPIGMLQCIHANKTGTAKMAGRLTPNQEIDQVHLRRTRKGYAGCPDI